MEKHPLSGALGVRLTGLDLSQTLDTQTVGGIRQAFFEHHVLVIPGQDLDAEAQVRFTAIFGEAQAHPLSTRKTVEGWPQVLILENRPGLRGAPNDYWHSDISHAAKPPLASILQAQVVPEGRGDTQFCNMAAAFSSLSEGLQQTLRGMRAIHSGAATVARSRAEKSDALPISEVPPPNLHPVVRQLPETKGEALFVNPHFTTGFEDMTEAESAPLLNYLTAHATRPENIYRHRWTPGDVLLWDNRAVMHYAVRDYDESMPRRMQRTTAAGDVPV